MNKAYTFDDIALVPQFTDVSSRSEPLLETWLTKNTKVACPIIAANMDTVISEPLAEIILSHGSIPIFHRFSSFEQQENWVLKFRNKTFVSCGLHNIDQTRSLLDLGAKGVCVDIAHGHSEQMLNFIRQLKSSHPDKEIIAGNVCTAMGYNDLVNAGADAVKVGVGPGAACTTRLVTSFGVPQFTAIRECARMAEKLRVPLIADGGIRNSRDIVLALAAGANTIMIGKLFAMTEESAAEKKGTPGNRKAKYRGQASEDFQNDYYGGLKNNTVAEGIDFWGPVTGSAEALISKLLGGVRSGMTYGGARTIKELQRKAEFVEVTPTYMQESRPRPEMTTESAFVTTSST